MKDPLQTALLVIALFISSNIRADDDHERARDLVKSGDIIPLNQLLQQVINTDSGKFRLLEAELEHESGRVIYELEIVDEHGVVRELLFDAKTGELLDEKED